MPIVTQRWASTGKVRFHWSWFAGTFSLIIIAVAAFTLWRISREISPAGVAAALIAQPPLALLFAGIFVVCGYLMLGCYDAFALQAIGCRHVPFRVAALGSFTSYTVGHNCGATVLTSGLIRYRIYGCWGLGVGDIARIAVITGMTYCLGNGLVLGFGFLAVPDAAGAIDRLPAVLNRLMGAGCLLALAAYVLWLKQRPRAIGRAGWKLVLPGLRMTLLQIGIGAAELVCVALAMYALLPAEPRVGLLAFTVIFVAAMLLGVASYVPGSVGVLEAAMFIALPQLNREQLLASLLTFRVLYFLLPLLMAAGLLGVRELRLMIAAARPKKLLLSGRK